jgi:hypothetical protein
LIQEVIAGNSLFEGKSSGLNIYPSLTGQNTLIGRRKHDRKDPLVRQKLSTSPEANQLNACKKLRAATEKEEAYQQQKVICTKASQLQLIPYGYFSLPPRS